MKFSKNANHKMCIKKVVLVMLILSEATLLLSPIFPGEGGHPE